MRYSPAVDPILSGDLAERPIAHVVAHLCRARVTGLLVVEEPDGVNRAFFLNGEPQGARTARLLHPIGRLLVSAGKVTQAAVDEALASHRSAEKLVGQVLIDAGYIDEATMAEMMTLQSRENFLSLLGLRRGRYEFHDGLVHLTDFVRAPLAPLIALYHGLLRHGGEQEIAAFIARIAFVAIQFNAEAIPQVPDLPAAERMLLKILAKPRVCGDLARRVPLAPNAIASFLFALDALGALQTLPPLRAEIGTQ